ncbi:uncharacterized protein BDCG_05572 [Blastomyces dermatitidis ER-3]|uniref:Hsp70-like protein n=3 Tax=Blastomyces TaxID=229219 RepID=A0A179UQZ9_BLAGS|nr:uncharacterized protein BDBG_05890 [Blastomyces gilchristii SLH14081]XP_045277185.1 uncharacterized protein BDCG_05572 [Blastomyces dermatitidis ER-3]EGE83899.1 hypothetical protein BDDG_06844 [Blastomyces dermatitidis ATCC 18188]EQL32082.1 hypothetical protein BDFG_05668 [Blastomyces dermatitidis ATCC 26199]EEQ90452.2 hypothetical protein BDCG_05572 [Blastomyces dermatitidis ER-3]OAT10223.1 hypothetical protein BDBG_05890 [Blastomyces gilchristii SLH14081]
MAVRNIPPETVIIGIDLGLTHTGVAFSSIDMEAPLDVDRWPGQKEVAKKVPTKLWYRAGCKTPISWGFDEPDELHPGMDVVDCFKLYLDPGFQPGGSENSAEVFWTHEDVQTWFIDFLTALRQHIIQYIRHTDQLADQVVGEWKFHPVEYIFSFPTTWQNPKVVDAFRRIVRSSGFGDCEAHSVEIKLTEAAAAAVYSAKNFKNQRAVQSHKGRRQLAVGKAERVRDGNVILICDAGGGTTDVSVLKVLSTEKFEIRGQVEEVLQLEQLDYVNGRALGSVQIDQAFQREIETRLKKIDYKSGDSRWSPKSAARSLTKGDFQTIKHNYGYQIVASLDTNAPRVPGLPKSYDNPEAGFKNGRIILTDSDIRWLFDEQIQRIFGMIDEQLERIEDITPPVEVTHVVLSGGLGSSPYVQDCFKINYGYGKAAKQILISEDPQLAVCRGLVIDRIHRLRHGHSVLSTRCSSISYGIVVNNRVRGSQTPPGFNGNVEISPYNGKRYIVNQIQWLIERDQIIQHQDIRRKFDRVFEATNSGIAWKTLIAMSRSPAKRLPQTINQGDADVKCTIESYVDREFLRQHAQPVKQRRWSSSRKPELQKIQYEVRLCIASSYVTFEVWLGDRVVGKSEEIHIAWQYTSEDESDRQVTPTEYPVDWSNYGRAKVAKGSPWPIFLR